jgi:CBS domain-containing protein
MKKHEPITHIMSTGLATLHHGDPLSKARRLMRERDVHHLPVVSGHKLVGIISWSDILRVSFGEVSGVDERTVDATLDHTLKLEDVMQKDVRTLKKTASIRDAGEILAHGKYHAVPIVDSDGDTLVGMVTSSDLIRYLVDQI